jgi:two-component system response regulator MprA
VLVVEDDERLLFAITEALGDAKYETRVAVDGHAAIQRLATFSPDVIVLDLMMPFVSGFEFLNWLKRSGMRVPVVLSTNADEHTADRLGAAVMLSKPFTLDQLLDAITAALKSGSN